MLLKFLQIQKREIDMHFTSNTALPIPKKYEARKKELLREIYFTEGVTKELKQWIAERLISEENSSFGWSRKTPTDYNKLKANWLKIGTQEEYEQLIEIIKKQPTEDSAWWNFAIYPDLEKLWEEIRNPQEQIAFVEALSYLEFEAAIQGISSLKEDKEAINKFVRNIKECGLILERTKNFKGRINSGLERMFIPSLFPILSEDEELRNSQENSIKGCITRITDNLDIVSLAHMGVFKKHDYFSLLVFSLLTFVNAQIEKESFVDLKTNKSKRRTAYLEKRTKELLQQIGLTKSLDFRTKQVMIAMKWKKGKPKEDEEEKKRLESLNRTKPRNF